MYKYYMTIDNNTYNALFLNHMEAADFLDANDRDGSEVIVHRIEDISIEKVLADPDFGRCSYSYETICLFLLGKEECKKRFRNVSQMETYLRIRGYLD